MDPAILLPIAAPLIAKAAVGEAVSRWRSVWNFIRRRGRDRRSGQDRRQAPGLYRLEHDLGCCAAQQTDQAALMRAIRAILHRYEFRHSITGDRAGANIVLEWASDVTKANPDHSEVVRSLVDFVRHRFQVVAVDRRKLWHERVRSL